MRLWILAAGLLVGCGNSAVPTPDSSPDGVDSRHVASQPAAGADLVVDAFRARLSFLCPQTAYDEGLAGELRAALAEPDFSRHKWDVAHPDRLLIDAEVNQRMPDDWAAEAEFHRTGRVNWEICPDLAFAAVVVDDDVWHWAAGRTTP